MSVAFRILGDERPGRPGAEELWRRSTEELDRLAAGAVFLSRRLAWPVARAAAAFTELKGWKDHGFAAEHDFTREKLGRSASWLRTMARIGRAGLKFPEMAAALSGEDGQAPLNTVAADWIARVADFGSIDYWIAFARQRTVREVKDAVQAFQEKGTPAPEPVGGDQPSPAHDDWDDPDADVSRRVRLDGGLCPGAWEVYQSAYELFRSVIGGPATLTSFFEAACTDYELGTGNIELDPQPPGVFPGQHLTRAEQERAIPPWSRLPDPAKEDDAEFFADIRRQLNEAREVIARAGQGSGFQVGTDLIALATLEGGLRRILGRVLSKLKFFHAWTGLGFMDQDQYVEERLGLARSTAMELIQVARFAQRHPNLGEKYDRGEINTRSALLLTRALNREGDEAVLERWLDKVPKRTVKRLEDELGRRRSLRNLGKKDANLPPDDAEWRESIARPIGYYKNRLKECLQAIKENSQPTHVLGLTLPLGLAQRFLNVLKTAQTMVNHFYGEEGEAELYLERRFEAGRTIAAYRIVGIDQVAFVAVMAAFIDQFDTEEKRGGAKRNPIAERDGYRCTAPGCTVKRGLEVHHVLFRSRGGGEGEHNKVLLCACHHQEGEHTGMMKVHGEAPLGLAYRQGPAERGVWFRNEKEVRSGH